MAFNIACPNCSMSLSATEADIGKQGKCSRCGTVFTIQMPQAATSYQPPQPQVTPGWTEATLGAIRVGEGISRGFSVLHSNLGGFILIALCFIGISIGIFIASLIPCLGSFISLANMILIQPALTCGFYRACLKQHDGSQAEVGDLFAEFAQWVDVLLLALATIAIALLVCLPGIIVFWLGFAPTFMGLLRQQQPPPAPVWPLFIIGIMLLLICVFVAMMALMYSYPALVDRRKGVGDAIKTSWRLMSSNPLGALGAVLLAWLIGMAAGLLCCPTLSFSLLYAMPAMQCVFASIYRTAAPPHAWPPATAGLAPPPTWQPPPAGPAAPLPPPQAPGGTF